MRGVTTSAFDVQKEEPILTPPGPVSDHRRLIDRLSPATANVLTVLGLGLPVVWYFWFVDHDSLNAVIGDQWSDVNVIRQSYANLFDWSSRRAQHFENRIFFPNLVVEALADTVQFNIRVEEFPRCSVVGRREQCSSCGPTNDDHLGLRGSTTAPLRYSSSQSCNTETRSGVFSWPGRWPTLSAGRNSSPPGSDRTHVAHPGGCTRGSHRRELFLTPGVLIWPAGLVLLYYRRRSLPRVGVWIVSAIFAYVLTFTTTTTPKLCTRSTLVSIFSLL